MTGPIRPADRPGGLLTAVVGSHARPSWFVAGIEAAERGEFGAADLAEMLDDGVDLAIRDQEAAGIEVVTDGEMRRAGFFTAEFYRHLTGVRPLPADRRLGAGGHDQQHRFEVLEAIAAPDGLGVVEEFRLASTRTTRPLKVTIPGPYTLSGRLSSGPGQVYEHRNDAAEAFVPILRTELEGLVAAGATFIQIDDPSPAIHPDAPSDFSALFNAAVEPVVGRVRLGAHLCFGNYLGRPLARRTYRPVLAAMLRFRVDELVLEFANREMAEVEILGEIAAAGRDVAAGVIDVKNSHLESAEEVAERIDAVLAVGVPPERLALVPDCGFSQTARWATTAKLRALVAGRDLVLGRTR
jgi:5-methyltetrahydropteroyltriglutamate--homocysteine methyltransferase